MHADQCRLSWVQVSRWLRLLWQQLSLPVSDIPRQWSVSAEAKCERTRSLCGWRVRHRSVLESCLAGHCREPHTLSRPFNSVTVVKLSLVLYWNAKPLRHSCHEQLNKSHFMVDNNNNNNNTKIYNARLTFDFAWPLCAFTNYIYLFTYIYLVTLSMNRRRGHESVRKKTVESSSSCNDARLRCQWHA